MKQSPGNFFHSGHVRIHSGRVALALISDMAGWLRNRNRNRSWSWSWE